jgi:hypothetical protein
VAYETLINDQPTTIISSSEAKRKQCGGDRYYANIRASKCGINK